MKKNDEIADLKKQVKELTEQVAELKKAQAKEGLYNTTAIGFFIDTPAPYPYGAWNDC